MLAVGPLGPQYSLLFALHLYSKKIRSAVPLLERIEYLSAYIFNYSPQIHFFRQKQPQMYLHKELYGRKHYKQNIVIVAANNKITFFC